MSYEKSRFKQKLSTHFLGKSRSLLLQHPRAADHFRIYTKTLCFTKELIIFFYFPAGGLWSHCLLLNWMYLGWGYPGLWYCRAYKWAWSGPHQHQHGTCLSSGSRQGFCPVSLIRNWINLSKWIQTETQEVPSEQDVFSACRWSYLSRELDQMIFRGPFKSQAFWESMIFQSVICNHYAFDNPD